MNPSEEQNDKSLRADLSQAFRLTDKWSEVDQLNSVASAQVSIARCALETALENIGLTEKEIEEQQTEEERKREKQEEQEWEEEREQIIDAIDQILGSLPSPVGSPGDRSCELTLADSKIVAEAVQRCLRNRPLSGAEAAFVLSLLEQYRRLL